MIGKLKHLSSLALRATADKADVLIIAFVMVRLLLCILGFGVRRSCVSISAFLYFIF